MDSRLGKQAIRPVRKRHMTAWEDECALKRSARGGCQTIWVSIAGPSKASFQTNKKDSHPVCKANKEAVLLFSHPLKSICKRETIDE
ncbi:hypothetical protein HR17_00880 [Porphyromonas gulae]|nr:hypothetical protein HR17_00880 [Porphyromonas gulae]